MLVTYSGSGTVETNLGLYLYIRGQRSQWTQLELRPTSSNTGNNMAVSKPEVIVVQNSSNFRHLVSGVGKMSVNYLFVSRDVGDFENLMHDLEFFVYLSYHPR